MNARILIVDDEEKVRKYLSRLLQKRGFEVFDAEDGRSALIFLQDKEPDLIILDVLMPGVSGLEVLPEIKRLRPDAEVLMLTGNASVEDGVEGIRRGAFDYLLKPVDINMLSERLHAALERRLIRREGIQMLDIPEMRS